MRVEAWQVQDTGLVAAPGPFRRLAGAVRHHRDQGEPWPDRVVLEVVDDRFLVRSGGAVTIGDWPIEDVTVRRSADGPPVTFVVQVPGGSRLLAGPAGPEIEALLAALA